LINIVKELKGKKMIVFVQYRAQIARIETVLNENGITAKQFVGKKDGVTRKIQEETITDFREGKFDVLVASMIGEEGLDIPAVDSVIFYEPVPSEIRSIQRRGRAARLKEGEITILMTKDTRDEYFYYASQNREKRMKKILRGMQKKPEITRADELTTFSVGHNKAKEQHKKNPTTKKTKVVKKAKLENPLSGQTKMTDF
ncbi:hypothetical protein KKD40_03175, partial [Candidatus Micrarchaeota archaeon]|nr:hypothetical protein [Candidatus Micrarchaeota archaeon]